MLDFQSKIYIAGHQGMVGSAVFRALESQGYGNLVTPSREKLDLIDQNAVKHFFQNERPDYVVVAAAKVGGIYANNTRPAEFIYENLMIESNLIHSAFSTGVKNLLFLGSSCIYPKNAPQPMKEEHLLTGTLEQTNEPYAIAKIAGIKLCESYNRQYGTYYRSAMPTNLYGPNDNFNLQHSHVIPATIRKIHEAKLNNLPSVEIWGTGKPKREFLHVDDMAAACVHIMKLDEAVYSKNTQPMLSHINVGTGKDISILDMAKLVQNIVGYNGEVFFNTDMPGGAQRKLLDVSRLNNLGWEANISLEQGLTDTYQWFLENTANIRV